MLETWPADTHNFGRSVIVSAELGHVIKPRPVLWEWMLLCEESPFRQALLTTELTLGRIGLFTNSLPNLLFDIKSSSFSENSVGILKAHSSLPSTSLVDYYQIGLTIALASWLGIGDLHFENVCCGLSQSGNLLLAPLDVECILNDFHLPSQTGLLPRVTAPRSRTGFGWLLQCKDSCSDDRSANAICAGFLEGIRILTSKSQELFRSIEATIAAHPSQALIRVILRPTQEYIDALEAFKSTSNWPDTFSVSERAQLERGDIPYYFRQWNDSEIYWLIMGDNWSHLDLPLSLAEKSRKTFIKNRNEFLNRKHFQSLTIAGTLQLMSHFEPLKARKIQDYGVTLEYSESELFFSGHGLSGRCSRPSLRD